METMTMGNWHHALQAVKQSDLVLEILDARLSGLTRHFELEQKILRKGKKLLLVLNKSDLISKKTAEREKKELEKTAPTVFVSGTKKKGIARLRLQLRKMAGDKKITVAIIGFPNTGKSTILNALAGRRAAKVSAQAGFTRGRQLVKLDENVFLVDTPGVIPYEQRNEFELMLVNSKSPNQLQDIENNALQLIEWIAKQNPGALKEAYGIEWKNDSEEFLEKVAQKKGKLSKGGNANRNAVSFLLIQDWQKGKIRV
jgi:ribosome biogenesis GTPase A